MDSISNRSGASITRRTAIAGLTALAAPVLLSVRPARAAESMNALVWCDHADEKLIKPFSEKFGVNVNVKTYEGTGTALSILEQSQPGDWDVIVIDATDVPRVAENGLFMELPDNLLAGDDMFPQFKTAPFLRTGGKLFAIPEKFGYYGYCYNNTKVAADDIKRGDAAWLDKYKGRIAVYDYYFPIIQMIGLTLGWKPSEIDADKLMQIREKLLAMKPNVKLVGDIVSVQNALVSGSVDIILGGAEFAVSNLIPSHPELDWDIPSQGGLIWTQGIAVLEGSQKKDLAMEFLKWILSPEGQGLLATSECYWAMPTNQRAVVDDTAKATLRWDKQPDYLSRSVFSELASSDLDAQMLDIWTEFLQA